MLSHTERLTALRARVNEAERDYTRAVKLFGEAKDSLNAARTALVRERLQLPPGTIITVFKGPSHLQGQFKVERVEAWCGGAKVYVYARNKSGRWSARVTTLLSDAILGALWDGKHSSLTQVII